VVKQVDLPTGLIVRREGRTIRLEYQLADKVSEFFNQMRGTNWLEEYITS